MARPIGKPSSKLIDKPRCAWCANDDLYTAYHDLEWGVPVHDDTALFERLVLEGAQAGLSWITILRKRENYRQAFKDFDPEKVARFDQNRIAQLLADSGIVRNRLKIESAVSNAKVVLEIQHQYGSLDAFFWRYVDGRPIQNSWPDESRIPAQTDLSATMSKDLKRFGFRFIGPTICYALMQATGMVNDHTVACFRHQEVKDLGKNWIR